MSERHCMPCPECERLGDTLRQLAEAQGHVRNHHLEPCVSCAATESERDAFKAELTALKDRGSCAYCNFGDEDAPGGKRTFGELQAHIEVCGHHPIARLKASLEQTREVITAARKLNPWCLVTHGHMPGGWEELQAALAALDAGKDK